LSRQNTSPIARKGSRAKQVYGAQFRRHTYGLFHLLIREATLNWRRVDQRALLARLFEHGRMKSASDKQRGSLNSYFKTNPAPCPELDCARHLHRVATAFLQAQQQRQVADYDNSKQWTRTEVLTQIALIDGAFKSWHAIRDEPAAQAYLISLLGTPKGA
jgi:hypothetical protein